MLARIKEAANRIKLLSDSKNFKIIAHFDTDGITSAAIFSRALSRAGIKFSLEIVKNLDERYIKQLPEDVVLVFLDLASGSLKHLSEKKTEIFIFDHHEVSEEIPKNVFITNSTLEKTEPLCSAAICYLFARELSDKNVDLANLAVVGMVGDLYGKNIGKIFSKILTEAGAIVKRGLLLYPSTRPIDKALEYSLTMLIPKINSSRQTVLEILRDASLQNQNGKYKALYELNEQEMRALITAIVLRTGTEIKYENFIGNIFLVKFFNKVEDARELSALINASSRMDRFNIAYSFCMGNKKAKEEAEKNYIIYRQNLIFAMKLISEGEGVLVGKDYLIINAKDKIRDTIIGTIASIISHSPVYQEGTIIVALAYSEDRIKVSARLVGETGRDVRELISKVSAVFGGEAGGHKNAAGCLIPREKENEFIQELMGALEINVAKYSENI